MLSSATNPVTVHEANAPAKPAPQAAPTPFLVALFAFLALFFAFAAPAIAALFGAAEAQTETFQRSVATSFAFFFGFAVFEGFRFFEFERARFGDRFSAFFAAFFSFSFFLAFAMATTGATVIFSFFAFAGGMPLSGAFFGAFAPAFVTAFFSFALPFFLQDRRQGRRS